jgi:hypothetical protein
VARLFFFFFAWESCEYLKILQGRKYGKEQVNINIYFLTTPKLPLTGVQILQLFKVVMSQASNKGCYSFGKKI